MRKRDHQIFSIALLDILSGALGAVIILFVAVPKATVEPETVNKNPPQALETEIQKAITLTPDNDKQITSVMALREIASEKEIESLNEKIAQLTKDNKSLENEIAEIQKLVEQKEEPSDKNGIPVDVGFRFKGKRIVFLIDVSGSMVIEDRIGQVKAGLKMLITSMGKEFLIDVVFFPGYTSSYQYLWGQMNPVDEVNKEDIYNFLFFLKPYGATPTRDVLTYALRNYPYMSDIVLLSDGAPTVNSGRYEENIEDVLRDIRSKNNRKIQINTIGVGSDFLKNKNNPKYVFLEKLAKQNNGFFYGF
ncbi:MAG: hypothetical protein COW00_07720 [Bdellovibrio sp. CG12_big_fil_rev_8_21_14_0_65_39_13]|nr:MAG: hypothetical protein COW78_12400 [Bdellovibrio sp. CG22_combo_CG10-13_8_21_14_all_39_27]PIQ60144.1 MAG: hypothetical protein COW00_07720 [Bdellovibrio sp. CG12_big_fil_rev_8_21_14_0_65_39_13]PIR36779.1 MAG: hypothetical protein COV37_01220 [Bdellovibrio sp. CG11_big_fil_rev_8_21_14_0_20_39_38]PJB54041.1 MAG: hypothetical protein CO099_03810 [Bdellovibrio sp. CG_4_9_14_3_um_filter_39_7]